MPTCNCGGKTVQIKKHTPKKASIPKASVPKGGNTKALSARAKHLSAVNRRKATAKAKANAAPCKC